MRALLSPRAARDRELGRPDKRDLGADEGAVGGEERDQPVVSGLPAGVPVRLHEQGAEALGAQVPMSFAHPHAARTSLERLGMSGDRPVFERSRACTRATSPGKSRARAGCAQSGAQPRARARRRRSSLAATPA